MSGCKKIWKSVLEGVFQEKGFVPEIPIAFTFKLSAWILLIQTLRESGLVNEFFGIFSHFLFLPEALKNSTELLLYKPSFHKSGEKKKGV